VATFFDVGDIGSLALPEVPVQMLRDGSLFEGSTGVVLSQNHVDMLEFADPSGSDQFDS
jgi:hypothetical protein